MQMRDETVVTHPRWVVACVWIGFPLLGAVAGRLLLALIRWLVTLPWVPFRGPMRLISEVGEPYATIGSAAIGFVAGLVLAIFIVNDLVTLGISGDRVSITRGGTTSELSRTDVTGVFFDGKKLVLLGRTGEELAREQHDLTAGEVTAAFRGHGYPWLDGGDPYRDEYRRWVEGMPDLPPGADVLLRARERALQKREEHDIAELRTELARLGVVVREEKTRQYWRRIGR
jgi:hypothetical protein